MHNNTPQTSPKQLIRVEFTNMYDIIGPKELQTISGLLKKRDTTGDIVSIKKIDTLKYQTSNVDNLIFELKNGSETLQVLLNAALKLADSSKEYYDIMENISFFIHNIIDHSKKIVKDLDEVLEYEGNKSIELKEQ